MLAPGGSLAHIKYIWRSRSCVRLHRIALEDEYFIKRKLYPNADFYSGIIHQAMGFRPEMFTVLLAILRTVGWLAQWQAEF